MMESLVDRAYLDEMIQAICADNMNLYFPGTLQRAGTQPSQLPDRCLSPSATGLAPTGRSRYAKGYASSRSAWVGSNRSARRIGPRQETAHTPSHRDPIPEEERDIVHDRADHVLAIVERRERDQATHQYAPRRHARRHVAEWSAQRVENDPSGPRAERHPDRDFPHPARNGERHHRVDPRQRQEEREPAHYQNDVGHRGHGARREAGRLVQRLNVMQLESGG